MKLSKKSFLCVSIIFITLFITLFILLKIKLFIKIDENIYYYFLGYKNSYIYNFFYYFTKLSGEMVSIIIFLALSILLFIKKKFDEMIFVILFSSISVFLTLILKYTIQKDRPLNDIVGLSGYSFPSGHAVLSVILAFMIYMLIKNLEMIEIKDKYIITGIIVYLFLSSLARIVTGAHWCSDVVGGLFVGVFCFILSHYIYSAKFNNRKYIC